MARPTPEPAARAPSESYGMYAGRFWTSDDFDETEELADHFAIPRE